MSLEQLFQVQDTHTNTFQFNEGMSACQHNQSLMSNPYAPETNDHTQWSDGWKTYHSYVNWVSGL